jgi:beta-glucanase (GH16 family)
MQTNRFYSILILVGLSFVIGPMSASAQSSDCARLVWSDEFDTPGAPDPARWNFETGGGGWGNNELQFYTNSRDNSYISNGTLKIHARKSQNGTWTSARMVTSGKASWKYGRFEIRAKLPAGRGTWPAIWMMPQSPAYGIWPRSGEIDIMEHVGYDMNKIHGTIHTEAYNHKSGTQKGGSITLPQVNNQFHIYAIEWTVSEIRWYANNQLYFTFKNENKTYREWPFDQAFFLILNIAIGGDWGGAQGIDPNLAEALMEIDYIRIYSTTIVPPVISGPELVNPGSEIILSTPELGDLRYKWNLPEGVTLVSGEGTGTILVRWNDQPGIVTVDAFNACDTVRSNPFSIQLRSKPIGEFWQIPFTGAEGNILWKSVAGEGNQITLSMEYNDLKINYNIQVPGANPYIYYDFPAITDLTSHREMWLQTMAAAGQLPGNIRIDLVDSNNQIDLTSLFKIDGQPGTGNFVTYKWLFQPGNSGWQLNRIARVRVYFNYGILGRKGAGEFFLRDLKMKNPDFTSIPVTAANQDVKVFPNPAKDKIIIHSARPITALTVTNTSGQVVLQTLIAGTYTHELDISGLKPGFYLLAISETIGKQKVTTIIKQ